MRNVILLTVDALRKDALGCYGNEGGLTPFIDSLQDECIRFTKGQASGPYTQASFPGLLTSSYYLEYGKSKGLSPQRTLLSEPLKQAGIVTAAFHSNPYLCCLLGWNRGWHVFYDSMEERVDPRMPYIRGDAINSKVAKWLSSHTQGGEYRSFFLWLHYMDIHEPYIPDRKYANMVDASNSLGPDDMYNLFEDTLQKRDVSSEARIKLLKKLYHAHVREIDDYVREFFGILENLSLLRDSIIIMTSDHGDEFNEHGGLSHDDKMYSELLDMPLLIYGTGRGGICNTLISNVDIPPTVIHLFGLEPVEAFEGHPLLPIEDYSGNGVFGEAIDQRGQRGGDIERDVYFYREQDLKVIYRANLDSWEMYDLKADPKELNDIVDTSSEAEGLKSKLKPRVRRWLKK